MRLACVPDWVRGGGQGEGKRSNGLISVGRASVIDKTQTCIVTHGFQSGTAVCDDFRYVLIKYM